MRVAGGLTAIPTWLATSGLFFNKSLFTQLGVPVPNETWTWDTLLQYGPRFTEQGGDGNVTRWLYGSDSFSFTWSTGPIMWVWAAGGDVFDNSRTRFILNEPAASRGLEFWASLMFQRRFGYSPADQKKRDVWDSFIKDGTVGMWDAPSWGVAGTAQGAQFDWDIAPLPKNPQTGQSAAFLHVRGLAAGVLKAPGRGLVAHQGVDRTRRPIDRGRSRLSAPNASECHPAVLGSAPDWPPVECAAIHRPDPSGQDLPTPGQSSARPGIPAAPQRRVGQSAELRTRPSLSSWMASHRLSARSSNGSSHHCSPSPWLWGMETQSSSAPRILMPQVRRVGRDGAPGPPARRGPAGARPGPAGRASTPSGHDRPGSGRGRTTGSG